MDVVRPVGLALISNIFCSEVTTEGLLSLNGPKESLEVSSAEALMVASLDDLKEESWTVLQRLREDLQQVALLVVVDEDLLSL